jgi:hypothetical protein
LTKSLNAPGKNRTPSFEKESCWPSEKFSGAPTALPSAKNAAFRLRAENRPEVPEFRVPYHFCDSCSEEYVEYIDALKGKKNEELLAQRRLDEGVVHLDRAPGRRRQLFENQKSLNGCSTN